MGKMTKNLFSRLIIELTPQKNVHNYIFPQFEDFKIQKKSWKADLNEEREKLITLREQLHADKTCTLEEKKHLAQQKRKMQDLESELLKRKALLENAEAKQCPSLSTFFFSGARSK